MRKIRLVACSAAALAVLVVAARPASAADPIRPRIARCGLAVEQIAGRADLGKGATASDRPT